MEKPGFCLNLAPDKRFVKETGFLGLIQFFQIESAVIELAETPLRDTNTTQTLFP